MINEPSPNTIIIEAPSPLGGWATPERNTPAAVPAGLLLLLAILVPGLLVYGMAVGNETQVAGIVAAIIGVVLILTRPFAGLVVFLGLLFTRPEESIPALAGMHFTLLVALVTLFGLLGKMWLDKLARVRTPLMGMMIGLACSGILSSVASGGDTTAAAEDFGRFLVLVFIIVNLVRSPRQYYYFVTSLLFLIVYVAGYTIYLYFVGHTIKSTGVVRPFGTGIFSDPNDLATIFVAGIALMVPRFFSGRWFQRMAWTTLVFVLLYAIYLCNSRGATIGLGSILISYIFGSQLPKKTKIALLCLGLVGFLGVQGSRMGTFDSKEASANQRFWYWDNGLQQLWSHPLTGIGYNNFMGVNGGMTAHNSFVLCFAELGLLGYFFWMGCIYFSFRSSRRAPGLSEAAAPLPRGPITPVFVEAFSQAKESVRDWAARSSMMSAHFGLLGYLVSSFWLSHTYSPVLYVLLTLPAVLQAQKTAALGTDSEENRPRAQDWLYIGLLCLVSIAAIQYLVIRYR